MKEAMQAIVTVHSSCAYNFDGAGSFSIEATGAVVDMSMGLILTNRHVVSEAPVRARAVFKSGLRETPITPVYVDHIHDFAFCKFDIKELHGLPLKAIELRPDLARVGQDIRVLGNDMARVMSILPGVISRVDCNPPEWDSCKFTSCGKYHLTAHSIRDPLYPSINRCKCW